MTSSNLTIVSEHPQSFYIIGRRLTLLALLTLWLSNCATAGTDHWMHSGHVGTAATAIGAAGGALLFRDNRVAGGFLGAKGGQIAGQAITNHYKNNKQSQEDEAKRKRDQRLQHYKQSRQQYSD